MSIPTTFRQMFHESATKYAESYAFLYSCEQEIKSVSFNVFYHDLIKRANLIYNICNGGNIAIMGKNSYEYVLAMSSCLCGAGKLFLVDGESSNEWVLEFFRETPIEALLYDSACKEKADMVISSAPLKCAHNIDLYHIGCDDKKDSFGFEDYSFDEMRIIFTTSGTSLGNKKRVMLSGRALLNALIAFDKEGFNDGKMRGLTQLLVLPLFHIYAFACSTLHAIYIGNTTYISSNPNNIENEMLICNPHYICVVPAILNYLYNRYQSKLANGNIDCLAEYFGANLYRFLCGGAKNNPQIIKGYFDLGVEVIRGYGMSETSPIISVNNSITAGIDFENVGRPVGCHELMIIDDEICVRGKNLMLGYYMAPDLTKAAYFDGWFRTGDIGHIGDNGLLYVTGRIKNVIVLSSGKKVIPEEIEETISKIPGIIECAVYSVDDALLSLYVYCDNLENYSSEVLNEIDNFNSSQPLYKKIKQITLGDVPLPKTSTNKVQRSAIARHAHLMEINNRLRKVIMDRLYFKTFITSDDLFSEKLHFDSFEMTSFLCEIEEGFSCSIDINKFLKVGTLLELSMYINELLSNK